jgi:hypothetical protein
MPQGRSDPSENEETAESNEMAIAADSTALAGAIEPSPSVASLRCLDEVNLLLAGALSGFGPYVAAFLAQQNWTQQNIGFVLTLGGLAGLLSQLPGGALLDAIRSKRVAVALGAGMVAAGALIIAIWPSFPLVLAAPVLQGITGGFLGLAIAAISLGARVIAVRAGAVVVSWPSFLSPDHHLIASPSKPWQPGTRFENLRHIGSNINAEAN